MGEQALSNYSYEAYLAMEAEAKIKHEFHDGFIAAMAGGSPEHSQICANVIRFTGNALDAVNQPCIVHTSDLRVRIEETNRSYYPDVSVVCGEPLFSEQDPHALTNPLLIIEVLSASTVAFDRGAKFAHYRQIPSLKEYVLISQDEAIVDTYFRVENSLWEIRTTIGLGEVVDLKSIGIELKMDDIYRMVKKVE